MAVLTIQAIKEKWPCQLQSCPFSEGVDSVRGRQIDGTTGAQHGPTAWPVLRDTSVDGTGMMILAPGSRWTKGLLPRWTFATARPPSESPRFGPTWPTPPIRTPERPRGHRNQDSDDRHESRQSCEKRPYGSEREHTSQDGCRAPAMTANTSARVRDRHDADSRRLHRTRNLPVVR